MTPKTFAIVDAANTFSRAKKVARGDIYMKVGLALDIMFKSLLKAHRDHGADHVVLACEGYSWRYVVYPQYKGNRAAMRAQMTPAEREEEQAFKEALDALIELFEQSTACTVLRAKGVEGDDFIARWIQRHPNDKHVIISCDSDFYQLLAPNVSMYNGVDQRLFTDKAIFDDKGNPMMFDLKSDGKAKVHGTIDECREAHDKAQNEKRKAHNKAEREREALWVKSEKARAAAEEGYVARPFVPMEFDYVPFSWEPEPNWHRKALFVKCVRGDSGDGIFSAYPRAPFKGTSKKIGICEAWDDRGSMGHSWNNFMLATWDKAMGQDEEGNAITKRVRVGDEYGFNEMLIDLTKQPQEIIDVMDFTIDTAIAAPKKPATSIGFAFLKFCGRYDLPSIAKNAEYHGRYLAKGYPHK